MGQKDDDNCLLWSYGYYLLTSNQTTNYMLYITKQSPKTTIFLPCFYACLENNMYRVSPKKRSIAFRGWCLGFGSICWDM